MTYICTSCGQGPNLDTVPCSMCGRRHRVIELEPATIKITGHPVGLIVEGDPDNPEGRRVQSRPASGGSADSFVEASGFLHATMSAPLDVGHTGEPHVIKTLVAKLRANGADVTIHTEANDARGEDAVLAVDGTTRVVQIVTVPNNPEVWRELNTSNTASISGTQGAVVKLVRDAIVAKSIKAKNTVLALDVAHISAVVNRSLVDAYLNRYGDPTAEHSFAVVWLVGVTPRSTIELR